MKRKLDKERNKQFENLLLSSLKKFNAIQIKHRVLIILLKDYLNMHFHTFVCLIVIHIVTQLIYIYIYI